MGLKWTEEIDYEPLTLAELADTSYTYVRWLRSFHDPLCDWVADDMELMEIGWANMYSAYDQYCPVCGWGWTEGSHEECKDG